MKTPCPFCHEKKWFWKNICPDCKILFDHVQHNMGQTGLGQLMDELIATGISKAKIKKFLESDPTGRGSIMDQLLAQLTNNLAEGIGVKDSDMKAEDVKRIRENPTFGASTKAIKD